MKWKRKTREADGKTGNTGKEEKGKMETAGAPEEKKNGMGAAGMPEEKKSGMEAAGAPGKNRWYSPSGTRIRKMLCMLVFCCFMAGCYFILSGLLNYGFRIYNRENFFDTGTGRSALQNDVTRLLDNVHTLRTLEGREGEFSIYDVGKGEIITYDADAVDESDFFSEGQGMNRSFLLQDWMIRGEQVPYNMTSLQGAQQFLNSSYAKNCYLYFSPAAFISLFEEYGIQNEYHRLSPYFSEEAYFIFSGDTQWLQEQELPMGSDNNKEVVELPDILDELSYAVYDPEQKVFYSVWDDYFDLYSQYVYSCDEMKRELDNTSYEEVTDNIVIPLLKCWNMDAEAMGSEIRRKRESGKEARHDFKDMEASGFLYYLKTENRVYQNADLADMVKRAAQWGDGICPAYAVVSGYSEDAEYEEFYDNLQRYNGQLKECPALSQALQDKFPSGSVLYFAVDGNAEGAARASCRVLNAYDAWNGISAYIWPVTVGTVFCAVMLLVLAVSLLITTGRKEKGAAGVTLFRFDRLPMELWALAVVLLNFAVVQISYELAVVIHSEDVSMDMAPLFGLGCLPFGIVFMESALSLARRIKAKNLFGNLLVTLPFRRKKGGKTGKKSSVILQWIKARYEKCRYKLMIWLTLLVLLQALAMKILMNSNGDGEVFGFGIFIYIFTVAIAARLLWEVERNIAALAHTVREITKGDLDAKCGIKDSLYLFQDLDDGINHIGDGLKAAVETSLKDERMKTELITNVSHDLKTPLTSIINYISLLKKEEMPNDEAGHYIEVLERKAQRLKHLTEDLVEAAKATSGNVELVMMPLTFDELIKQALGEFEDKFKKKNLTLVADYPKEPAVILADGRRLYRVIENVLENAYKYAMEGTRIYAELSGDQKVMTFILKNVSAAPLNISPEELMERFTRGDASRTTEGSGLGLSIAKDLTRLMGGNFEIRLDGDLFKVIVSFPGYERDEA